MQETEEKVLSLGLENPLRTACQPNPAFMPGESYRQWSLADYSPQKYKELDMTEVT